jgi:hypothetical protein
MALKPVVDKIEEVPEAFRGEYEASEGKFRLKLDGELPEHVADRNKLKEFRDTNIALGKEVAGLKATVERVKDIDPEEYKKAKDRLEALEKRGVKGADDIQATVTAALTEFQKTHVDPLRTQLTEAKKKEAAAQEKLNESRYKEVIGSALAKVGAKPDAVDFLVTKAKNTFTVAEGEVKALDGKYSPKNVTEPISVDEWVPTVIKEYPSLFEKSNGGGGKGGVGAGGVTGNGRQIVNPTPEELGRINPKDLAEGKVQIVHTK